MNDNKIYCVMFLKDVWSSVALCMQLLKENNINWVSYQFSEHVHIFNTILRTDGCRVKLDCMTEDVFILTEY